MRLTAKKITRVILVAIFMAKATGLFCYSCHREKENWKCNEKEPIRCKPNEVCIIAGRKRLFKACMKKCSESRGDEPSVRCRECDQDLCNAGYDYVHNAEPANPPRHSVKTSHGTKYILFAKPSTFWEARLGCASSRGVLATIHSSTTQKFIQDHFISDSKATTIMETAPPNATIYPIQDPFGIWIGLRRAKVPGIQDRVWFWTDDGALLSPRDKPCNEKMAQQYQNWEDYHPSKNGSERCGLLSGGRSGRWKSESCGRILRGYLCEYPTGIVRQSTILDGAVYTYEVLTNPPVKMPKRCVSGQEASKGSGKEIREAFSYMASTNQSQNRSCREEVVENTAKNGEKAQRDCLGGDNHILCETDILTECPGVKTVSTAVTLIENRTSEESASTQSIISPNICPEYVKRNGENVLTFAATDARRFSHSLEKCPNGRPRAVMFCSGGDNPEFLNYMPVSCERLQVARLRKAVENKAVTPPQAMTGLHTITLFEDRLSLSNLSSIQDIFTTLSGRVPELSPEAFSNALGVVSGLQRALGQRKRKGTHNLVKNVKGVVNSLSVFAQHVKFEPNETRQTFDSEGVDMEIVPFDYETLSSENAVKLEHFSPDQQSFIRVIPELGRSAPGKKLRALFTTYETDDLFPTEEDVQVNSVISATITDGEKIYSVPVEFSMHVPIDSNVSSNTCVKKECGYYDPDEELWKVDGCRKKSTSREVGSELITCECDHTTSFSVVVSQHAKVSYALDVVSTIGLSVCIVCFLATIIIFVFTPELRRVRSALTHTNLCACLAIAYLIFLVGVEATGNRYCCLVVAFLIHFFLLTAWGWMAVESITMYRMFVRTLEKRVTTDGPKTALIVYAVSAAIVLTTLSFAVLSQYMGWNQKKGCEDDVWSSYISEGYCWLQGNSLYFGFLLIVGIALCFNIFFAVVIIKAITWGRKAVNSSVEEKPIVHVLRAVLVALLLGAAWIFAVPLAISRDETVQEVFGWLFATTIFSQGVFVFYFFCLRRKDVRDSWTSGLARTFSKCGRITEITTAASDQPHSTLSPPKFRRTPTSSTCSEVTRKTTTPGPSSFISPKKEPTATSDKCAYNQKTEAESKSMERSLDLVEFTGEEVFET